jgi:hypothetical protein
MINIKIKAAKAAFRPAEFISSLSFPAAQL